MKSKAFAVSAVLCVLIAGLWYSQLYQPTKDSAAQVRDETVQAARENQGLEAQVAELKALDKNRAETKAELAKLHDALPEKAQLASFIRDANKMADDAGIDWVSVAPTEPALTGQISTIAVNIQVKGGYFQVLDYLTKMEALPRLLVVDSVGITSSGTAAASGTGVRVAPSAAPGSGDSFGGAPELSVTMAARMFTTAGVTPPSSVPATPVPTTAPSDSASSN